MSAVSIETAVGRRPISERLAKMYALRERLELEISAEEKLCGVAASRSRRRSRHEPPECGTESAYQRHRYRGEHHDLSQLGDPCGCLAAHAEYNRLRDHERKAREKRAVLRLVTPQRTAGALR